MSVLLDEEEPCSGTLLAFIGMCVCVLLGVLWGLEDCALGIRDHRRVCVLLGVRVCSLGRGTESQRSSPTLRVHVWYVHIRQLMLPLSISAHVCAYLECPCTPACVPSEGTDPSPC